MLAKVRRVTWTSLMYGPSLRFSRMRAKRVVVKWTMPSSSMGWFMRMSFLKARRSGHLEPKPSGGSMFFSMSYISV